MENLKGKFDRPEDVLETDESLELTKRERKFTQESGFKKLRELKIFIDEVQAPGKLLNGADTRGEWLVEFEQNPEIFAYSNLGFEISTKKEDLDKAEVEKRKVEFLEDQKQPLVTEIDEAIEKFKDFSKTSSFGNINWAIDLLKGARESLWRGEWKTFAERINGLKKYLFGMRSVTNNLIGDGAEKENR